jgi:hypothetical protein
MLYNLTSKPVIYNIYCNRKIYKANSLVYLTERLFIDNNGFCNSRHGLMQEKQVQPKQYSNRFLMTILAIMINAGWFVYIRRNKKKNAQ